MGEMEISRGVAERSLREHMGNVVEALIDLSNWPGETDPRAALCSSIGHRTAS